MNPSLMLVMSALLTWGIGEGMFLYFVPLYMEQLGADPIKIGSAMSAFGAAMMITHIPAGLLADRFGRRPLMVTAWVFGLVATVLMSLAASLPTFIVGYLFYGLTAFVASPLFSYVTAARGSLSPGRAMTLTSAAFNLGAVIGPLLGGWIGERFGLRAIFPAAAVVFGVSTAMVVFLRPQPRDHHDGDGRALNLLANGRYLTFLGVTFVATFVMFLPQPLTPNFLQNERGVSLGQMGLILAAGSLGNVALNLLLGYFHARPGFMLAQASVGLFALLLWRGSGLYWYAAAYFLLGGFRAGRMLALAQVRPLIHQAQMGLAYGVTESANSLAMVLAPLLAGFLYDRNPASVYPLSLGLIGFALLVTALFAPRQKTPTPVPLPSDD